MTLLDGKKTAADIRAELAFRAAQIREKLGREAGLAVVLIGDDPASEVYVRNKVGIASHTYRLPAETSQEEAEALVCSLAKDGRVDGILVQLPLPGHLDEKALLRRIPAQKDVDGFSAENMGLLAKNEGGVAACTPRGVMELLHRYQIPTSGKRAVVIGRSNIVGRPMALLLLNADATVTVCHSKTKDLKSICAQADILVAALGKPRFITADMVKEGAAVIDVGISRVDGKLVGDVDFEEVEKKASFITPVPGGVGPMTIAMLLLSVVEAAEKKL